MNKKIDLRSTQIYWAQVQSMSGRARDRQESGKSVFC